MPFEVVLRLIEISDQDNRPISNLDIKQKISLAFILQSISFREFYYIFNLKMIHSTTEVFTRKKISTYFDRIMVFYRVSST